MIAGASVANSAMPLKTYFGVLGVKSVIELVVDGQVRRQDEEVVEAVGEVEVADERAHQARLADAGRQRKAEDGKFPLEVRDRRKLASNGVEAACESASFLRRHDLRDPVEDLQRPALRRAQAQATGDGVD